MADMAVSTDENSSNKKIILSAVVAAVSIFCDNSDEIQHHITSSAVDLLVSQRIRRRNLMKIVNYYENTIPRYNNQQFRHHFRLTRITFEQLCNKLHFLKRSDVMPGKSPIRFEKMILIFIWTVANQESFRGISDRFAISKSAAHASFIAVAQAIKKITPIFIKWLESREIQHVIDEFSHSHGFPGVVGAVDGTHIAIKAPKNSSDSYINRKGYHSIILQAVCNAQMKFIRCYAGEVGSVHDARVLRKPSLYSILRNPLNFPNYSHLIGDAAYPCMPTLLTPFRDNGHLTLCQKIYNEKISATRCIIERAFALLKGRFRRLKHLDMSRTDLIPIVIIACCTLHNFCLEFNDIDEDMEHFNFSVNGNCNIDYCNSVEESGAEKREFIASLLY